MPYRIRISPFGWQIWESNTLIDEGYSTLEDAYEVLSSIINAENVKPCSSSSLQAGYLRRLAGCCVTVRYAPSRIARNRHRNRHRC